MCRIVRPRRMNGVLPFGPASNPNTFDYRLDAIADAGDLAAAVDKWYRSSRMEYSELIGKSAAYFRSYFLWEAAAGRPATQHSGNTAVHALAHLCKTGDANCI